MEGAIKHRLLLGGGLVFFVVSAALLWIARSHHFDDVENDVAKVDIQIPSQNIKAHTKQIKVKNEQARLVAEEARADFVASTPKKLTRVFASSLEGTEIDGRLRADAHGQLIVDLEVRDFFDYFLNTVGEVEPETALAEIEAVAQAYLPEDAAQQAMTVLEQYLAFKEEAVQLMSQPMPDQHASGMSQIETFEWALSELKRIRRETMSPETVEAFFSLEESYSEYTLAAIRIQSDDTISSQDKAALIAFEREKLPENLRKTEETLHADAQAHAQVEQVIEQGDEQALTTQLRQQGYDEQQIQSIVSYQQSQTRFDARYEEYKLQKEKLMQSGLSEKDRMAQLERIQTEFFRSEQELTQAKVRDLRG